MMMVANPNFQEHVCPNNNTMSDCGRSKYVDSLKLTYLTAAWSTFRGKRDVVSDNARYSPLRRGGNRACWSEALASAQIYENHRKQPNYCRNHIISGKHISFAQFLEKIERFATR